jgi:hypothetical protein
MIDSFEDASENKRPVLSRPKHDQHDVCGRRMDTKHPEKEKNRRAILRLPSDIELTLPNTMRLR